MSVLEKELWQLYDGLFKIVEKLYVRDLGIFDSRYIILLGDKLYKSFGVKFK